MDPSREICRGHQQALSPWSKTDREGEREREMLCALIYNHPTRERETEKEREEDRERERETLYINHIIYIHTNSCFHKCGTYNNNDSLVGFGEDRMQ